MNAKEIEIITKKLYSTNSVDIMSALETIAASGSSNLIPALVALYGHSDNNSIKSKIENILFNIKSPDAVPFFVEELSNCKNNTSEILLLNACWNTGLDFSAELELFIDIFAQADFITAFEAFTVIDNTEPDLITPENAQTYLTLIQSHNSKLNSDKKALAVGMESMFEAIIST